MIFCLMDEEQIWGFYQQHKHLKNGEYLQEEFRYYVRKDVFRGVFRVGNTWAIPEEAQKPKDARIRSGRYIKGASIS